jgi:DnaJ-class molecular chaperone
MDFKDYYQILGVERQATSKEIKSAYRALARKLHPDVNPGDPSAEKKFAEINEAFEVLGDDEERKKYNEIADYVKATGHPPQPSYPHQEQASEQDEASFFEQFFGRRRSRAAPHQGADLHAEVEISLREALAGSLRRLSLERQEPCGACGGSGIQGRSVCPACRGLGQVIGSESLEVKIPSGVTEGSTVRIPGKGEGNPRGDLLLQIRLAPDPVYRVEKHDLHGRYPERSRISSERPGSGEDGRTAGRRPLREGFPANPRWSPGRAAQADS